MYSESDKAKVTDVYHDNQWIRIKTEADAHLFDEGVISVYGSSVPFSPIDYTCRDISYHTYNLGELPYLWGTYDKKKSWNNSSVQIGTDGIITAEMQQAANYIMLTISIVGEFRENMRTAMLQLADSDENVFTYSFTLKSGQNRYIFRVSSDWYWHNGRDIQVKLSGITPADVDIKLLSGD
ncbi:hypothetical protein ACYULU_11025 [Breznakiellaceae bacterium SP9]